MDRVKKVGAKERTRMVRVERQQLRKEMRTKLHQRRRLLPDHLKMLTKKRLWRSLPSGQQRLMHQFNNNHLKEKWLKV